MIMYDVIVSKTAEALIRASTTFRPDQIEAYERAVKNEDNIHAKWVLESILENAAIAKDRILPLCDDTGIPHVFLEIGDECIVPAGFLAAIEEGIAKGLKELPGRPMAVLGDDKQRISQSEGLSNDPSGLAMAPIQIRRTSGNKMVLTVLMLGGGPEIRGKTQRVFHKHSVDAVLDEMIVWAKDGVQKLGCLPCVLGFGIGRTNVEAASLALEAMKNGNILVQSEMEKRVTEAVNKEGYGALGLGGKNSVLATFIKVGHQRASGVRIVSLRVGCCFDPRKATVIFGG
ncbi:MAG: fumarate hydratase [Clostridiaceae bacterium]|nr:fumarate hydratase [Clostridiaceae bacterium]